MKKILFPTDFSENSLHAFVYTLQLAKKLDAEILTMHVYPVDVSDYAYYGVFLVQNYNITEWGDFENYKSEVPKLRELAEKNHAGSVKISHILERGDVVDKILEIEASENVDYIVLGTKGATGLKEVFLGSVAEKVINRASGMVLAIPAACKFPAMSNILLLAKYEKPYLKIVHQALRFADALKAHIDVLQIKDAPDRSETRVIKEWSREFADADISFHMFATKEVEEMAIDFADSHHNNLVALAVHEKGFFEKLFFFSLSRQMAFHSHIPVLAIHSKPNR
jgi:nucleotide-binding universal stress UspA family protein